MAKKAAANANNSNPEGATVEVEGSSPDPLEATIAEKVRAGLTREQAIEVLKSQAAHDAALAE